MFDQTLGIYNVVWGLGATAAFWWAYRIYSLLKSIHYMLQKWFVRDYIEPLEAKDAALDDEFLS